MPGPLDYAAIALPPSGFFTGAYRRWGNKVKYDRWYAVCQCALAPGTPAPPAGARVTVTGGSGAGTFTASITASGATRWTATLVSTDVDFVGALGWGMSTTAPPGTVPIGMYPDAWGEFASGGWSAVGQTSAGDWGHNADPAVTYYLLVKMPNTADSDVNVSGKTAVVDFAPVVARQLVDAPPAMPTGGSTIPAAPGCPTVTDSQGVADLVCSLQRTVDVLNSKLDYLATAVFPAPTATAEDSPTPATSGTPITRPALAVGVIVECTAIPTWVARRGEPSYYGRLGHAFMSTASGPIRSVELVHNPQVMFFPNQLVQDVTLDLEPGVSGQVRFLNAPK